MSDMFYSLMMLAFLATFQTIALEIVFENQLYKHFFGSGLDGNGSKYFSPWDIRPYVSIAVGLFISFAFQVQLIKIGFPTLEANPNFMGNYGSQVDMILTGLMIGGGTQKVKAFFNSLKDTAKDARDTAEAIRG